MISHPTTTTNKFVSLIAVSVLYLLIITSSRNDCRFCCTSFSIPQPSSTMVGIRPYALNVQLHILPERRDEFLKVITYDAQQTLLTEPGALQFTMGWDVNDNNIFHIHEQYKTQSDFNHHCSTQHYEKWQEFCNTQPFMSDPIVQTYICCTERYDDGTTSSSTSSTYCLNVEICIKDSVRDEFLSVINNNQIGSRTNEPLCKQYDYGESDSIPNHFYFHEEFIGNDNGKEGFQAHTKVDHFLKWEEFVSTTDPFIKDPIIHFYNSIPL